MVKVAATGGNRGDPLGEARRDEVALPTGCCSYLVVVAIFNAAAQD